MARAVELILTILQLGPIFALSIHPNPLNSRRTPRSREAHEKESEITTIP